MQRYQVLARWVIVISCWMVVHGFWGHGGEAAAQTTARATVKVMLMFSEVGAEGIQAVENTLARAFEQHGYSVIDHQLLTQLLQRDADVLKLYDVEAAKYLGSRLGADIVISGKSRARIQEKKYSSLGGKTVTVAQANVGAKAILVTTGKVLTAENALARKPFDTTGDVALEVAAEALASKLIKGIDQFLTRPTRDYRLVVLNIDHQQALMLQDTLRTQVEGVQDVTAPQLIKDTVEFEVHVAKQQDLAFKRRLFARLLISGLGYFEIVAREGETLYLQRTPGSQPRSPAPTSQPKRKSSGILDEPHRNLPTSTTPKPQSVSIPYLSGYRKSWAVVIGINNYTKWPKLEYAVADAEEIAKRLKRIGFDNIISIYDQAATQEHILRVLGDELYTQTTENDRVVIFFAGHGQTQDLPNGEKVGYIIPVNGDTKNYYSTAISMHQLQDLSKRIRAKHIFYILDACFSGTLLNTRGLTPQVTNGPLPLYDSLTGFRVRQVLTAGGTGEQVAEKDGHGLFTNVLLAGLGGTADLDRDGYITASELYQFVSPRVMQASQNGQNPAFGKLESGQGELIFQSK